VVLPVALEAPREGSGCKICNQSMRKETQQLAEHDDRCELEAHRETKSGCWRQLRRQLKAVRRGGKPVGKKMGVS
jgi:hypothetical protein